MRVCKAPWVGGEPVRSMALEMWRALSDDALAEKQAEPEVRSSSPKGKVPRHENHTGSD